MRSRLPLRALALAIALLAASANATAGARATSAPFSAHGSVQQVYVTGVTGRGPLLLVNPRGRVLARRPADSLGAALFRNLRPGSGYHIRQRVHGTLVSSPALRVLRNTSAPPSTSIYSQRIPASGYGYLTTRDGTRLAIDVRLPAGPGPYPTLFEYSGYGYADPAGAQNGISQVAQALGFAVVDVNMRGTGCSGGAYDYFEPLQSLDGYDVIETVARQPWVRGHRVGMIGISYGGISQLFVGATAPPHLAALAPLSVIDDSATTLDPGGILNTGFGLNWEMERVHDAKPASPTGGQAWAFQRIQQGDRTCKANQALHAEAVNLVAKTYANQYYVPAVADPLSPVTFVHKITAPTFVACQWTDEQTGGHCPDLAEHMTGTRHRWFTFTNGTHVDSLDPYTSDRFFDFLELYVAHVAPRLTPAQRLVGPILYQTALGISGVTLPPDPIQNEPSYAAALAAFQRLPEIRVLFDNGAGGPRPGMPYPAFERSFPRFPIPGTRAASFYLGRGTLQSHPPRASVARRFSWRPFARPLTDFTGDTAGGPNGLWTATPPYRWTHNPAGTSLSYISPPLSHTTVAIGAGAVHAWIKVSVPDVDLQVTLTEVRPDGKEVFVQGGWLRASLRALDPAKSTLLEPVLSLRRATAAPLPRGRFAAVVIPLYYEGHVYRKGSRIRITISAPNGDQPTWSFSQLHARAAATVTLAASRSMPSRLILPVVGGITVPSGLPPCPGLRGEPCRTYRAT